MAVGTIPATEFVVPVKRGKGAVDTGLRTEAKSAAEVEMLLAHLGLRLPTRSKRVRHVV